MKNIKYGIALILICIALIMMIGAAISSIIFQFQNPDMTEIRCLIENPGPSIVAVIALIIFLVGSSLIKK